MSSQRPQRPPGEPDGPELLGEVLGRLFTARGWGRKQERLRLEQAWVAACGPQMAKHTRVAALRRGVLEIDVASAALMGELNGFFKRGLLQKLRTALPDAGLMDLRFRSGVFPTLNKEERR
jgi:predicted nucleic acid-binding Zn ribbon protein